MGRRGPPRPPAARCPSPARGGRAVRTPRRRGKRALCTRCGRAACSFSKRNMSATERQAGVAYDWSHGVSMNQVPADVDAVSPVLTQVWQGRARSQCRCGRDEPGAGSAGPSPACGAVVGQRSTCVCCSWSFAIICSTLSFLLCVRISRTRSLRCSMQHYKHATDNVQETTCSGRHAKDNMQRTTCKGQRATDNMQRTTCKGQRAADNMQRITCDGQRATDNAQRTTCNGQRATDNSQHPKDDVRPATPFSSKLAAGQVPGCRGRSRSPPVCSVRVRAAECVCVEGR